MKPRCAAVALAAFVVVPAVSARAADSPAQGISLAQQSADQWRASKIVGVTIYGPDNKVVGKIEDVLMNHEGGAQDVIVGVGGFLGIGEKDVAIPFKAVNFSDKPMPVATASPDNNLATPPAGSGNAAASPNASAPTGGMANLTPGLGAPADTLGTASNPPMGSLPADAAAVPSTAYPSYGTIAFTADQLKSAPSFKYAH